MKLPHPEKDYEAERQASFPMTGNKTQCEITCSELRNITGTGKILSFLAMVTKPVYTFYSVQ